MALLPPRVIDPLTGYSQTARVEGQITGATIEVFKARQAGVIGSSVTNP
jgi:hypothetical protein